MPENPFRNLPRNPELFLPSGRLKPSVVHPGVWLIKSGWNIRYVFAAGNEWYYAAFSWLEDGPEFGVFACCGHDSLRVWADNVIPEELVPQSLRDLYKQNREALIEQRNSEASVYSAAKHASDLENACCNSLLTLSEVVRAFRSVDKSHVYEPLVGHIESAVLRIQIALDKAKGRESEVARA